MLPDYLSKAVPNPPDKRGPWYANTAPSYAGIFLWIVFYKLMAEGTLSRSGVGVCLAGLAVAGLLSWLLYYYAPAMLGMKTGFPLYVVGSSAFGTKGGYLMPGLLMGALQVGWFAVNTSVSTDFILRGVGVESKPGTLPFIVVGVIWAYSMAYIGVKGIQYVARFALLMNLIPLLMIVVAFLRTSGGIAQYHPAGRVDDLAAFTTVIALVIGFFATAGAAGADFGMSSRNASDVRWGGFVGIALAILVAGGLPILAVAGAHGLDPQLAGFDFADVIQSIGGLLASAMFLLFALASMPPACFCAFIAGNSFSTMIPRVPRMSSSMAGVTISVVLAVTGVAANLVGFFTIVGASFGPICGAIAADYLLSGKRWSGPREGVNWAGYLAWAIGFAVGVWPGMAQPAVLYSFVVGFGVYAALAKAGLQPRTVEMPAALIRGQAT